MNADYTSKKIPTGSANDPAGPTDGVTVPNSGQRIKHAPEPAEPTPQAEPQDDPTDGYTEAEYILDSLHEQIHDLQVALSLANLGDVKPEDRDQAANLIEELRKEVKMLKAMNRALTVSRDEYQSEIAPLKKQILRHRREIDKLTGIRTI